MQARNHPAKGSTIKVEPIRERKDLNTIKKLLADKPRDLALFVLGINTNLRASDLLSLKAGQVRGVKAGGDIELREKKTGKLRRITLNQNCTSAIQGPSGQPAIPGRGPAVPRAERAYDSVLPQPPCQKVVQAD